MDPFACHSISKARTGAGTVIRAGGIRLDFNDGVGYPVSSLEAHRWELLRKSWLYLQPRTEPIQNASRRFSWGSAERDAFFRQRRPLILNIR